MDEKQVYLQDKVECGSWGMQITSPILADTMCFGMHEEFTKTDSSLFQSGAMVCLNGSIVNSYGKYTGDASNLVKDVNTVYSFVKAKNKLIISD